MLPTQSLREKHMTPSDMQVDGKLTDNPSDPGYTGDVLADYEEEESGEEEEEEEEEKKEVDIAMGVTTDVFSHTIKQVGDAIIKGTPPREWPARIARE